MPYLEGNEFAPPTALTGQPGGPLCIDCGARPAAGKSTRCEDCRHAHQLALRREWRANHLTERRAREMEYNAAWRERHPERAAAHNTARRKHPVRETCATPGCNTRLEYGGRGARPIYCPACKVERARQARREYNERNPGHRHAKPAQQAQPVQAPKPAERVERGKRCPVCGLRKPAWEYKTVCSYKCMMARWRAWKPSTVREGAMT
jgi:hypothetical protein